MTINKTTFLTDTTIFCIVVVSFEITSQISIVNVNNRWSNIRIVEILICQKLVKTLFANVLGSVNRRLA